MDETVWRIGRITGPLAFTPHAYNDWQNRFDDVQRQYRTLYVAVQRITCFREVLADFRPDTKALADFQAAFDEPPGVLAGEIDWQFRANRALAPARVELHGPLVDVDDVSVRQQLEHQYAALLHGRGVPHLDIGELRTRDRVVTQTISRSLYDRGVAAIRFGSRTDNQPCLALLEGRVTIHLAGEPERLTDPIPELLRVCSEYSLVLREQPTKFSP